MTLLQRDTENFEQGIELGEQKMAILTEQLTKAGGFNDLERAAAAGYWQKLYLEFRI